MLLYGSNLRAHGTRQSLVKSARLRSALGPQLASRPARGSRVAPCSARAAVQAGASVQIIIQGRGLEVTDTLRQFAIDKLQKVAGKFEQAVKEVDIKLTAIGGQDAAEGKKAKGYKTEITVYTLRNGVVRAEDSENSLYTSIEVVAGLIERKLTRTKGKAIQKGKWPGHGGGKGSTPISEVEDPLIMDGSDLDDVPGALPDYPEYEESNGTGSLYSSGEVVRVKKTPLQPLTPDEAIEQLEQLGHTFFVYRDKDTDSVRVLYARKEYGYGIIVPE